MTQLQVGKDASRPVNLIVSTLAEAEFLLPMLEEYKKEGRKVNVSLMQHAYAYAYAAEASLHVGNPLCLSKKITNMDRFSTAYQFHKAPYRD